MGFSVSKQPSYMYQTPSGYIFRLRIPKDLKGLVGKCEFRYSLRSGALRVAKHRARCIASYIQQLFIKVRKNMTAFTPEHITQLVKESVREALGDDKACSEMTATVTPGSIIVNGETALEASSAVGCNGESVLPPERIAQLVQQYIRETLDNDEKCRAIGGTISTDTMTLEGMSILESSNMKADEAQALLKSVTRWIQQADHSVMHPVTERILNAEGVVIDPASETYKTLSRELLKAFQSVLNVRILRSAGDYSVTNEELVPALKYQAQVAVEAPRTKAVETPVVKYSQVQESYLIETEKADSWTEKTKAENLSIFTLFVRVMGDMNIEEINRKLMSEYKDILMKLPPNLNKLARYKGLSIEEIIALKPEKTISVNTIN